MRGRRVVVTGLGVVTSLGSELEGLWEGLLAGRSGIGRIALFEDEGLTCQIAGEVWGWDPLVHFDKRQARRLDRFCQFGLVATRAALADSGLDISAVAPPRVGCIVGSGVGGLAEIQDQAILMVNRGSRRVSPLLVPKMMANAISGEISIEHGFQGPNYTPVSACASGAHAIALAAQAIADGLCDVAVTGGAEAALTRLGMAGFCSAKAMSTRNDEPQRASRPFDVDRDGFVMGEGAGVLILEAEEHARARGARVYAEVRGAAYNADASHITAPAEDGEGASRAMSGALADAGLAPEDVDYVNAHGTSTPINDPTETRAIRTTFGAHADRLVVTSTKSMIGHLLGASGGVEAVVVALSIARGAVHPTLNHETPDPGCDLDYVPGAAREMTVRAALSNSFGFGGHNVSLCLAGYDG